MIVRTFAPKGGRGRPVRESKDKNFGSQRQTDAFEDLVAAGVIDRPR